MDRYLYRGKEADGYGWVVGCLMFDKKVAYGILPQDASFNDEWVHIIPETVGQYTGQLSFYNEPLYDGDIVQSFHFKDAKGKKHYLYHVIEWRDEVSGWYARSKDAEVGASGNGSVQLWVYLKNAPNSRIIGNIHEGV